MIGEDGLPGTKTDQGIDYGDCAAIYGTILALDTQENLETKWQMINPHVFFKDDIPVRHPSETEWWGQKDRFSRDQMIGFMCAAIRFPQIGLGEKLFKAHKKNWFLFAWNSKGNGKLDMPVKPRDFTGFHIWATWLRYKKPWWRYLVLWVLDLELLINSYLWYFKESRVTRNHMLLAIFSYQHDPTFISRAAFKITDFVDLTFRWHEHCFQVGEYATTQLFYNKWRELQCGSP